MRAIVGMDYHLASSRLDVGRRLLKATTALALEKHCSLVIIAGDMIDEKHGVRVDVLQMLYTEMEISRKKGVTYCWLKGNHELGVKSQPHNTIMSLFAGVCHCLIQPTVWELDNSVLFFLPWYLAQEYIAEAASLSRTARQYAGRLKILLSHIGLDEGKASPSNMYVQQAVSLKHLEEEAYDLVILGDYHHRQKLSPKTFYGGCPISHVHGDDNNNGVWLLDTTQNLLEPVPFAEPFPSHKTWDVLDPHQSVLWGYNAQDHNRIRVPREWVGTYQSLYPTAQVQARSDAPDTSQRRLKCLENQNSPEAIWNQYGVLKGTPPAEIQLGNSILKEVANRIQAQGK